MVDFKFTLSKDNLKLYPSPNFFLIKSDDPTANNYPLDIIPILLARTSASSK